jgi:hypothetical protein
MGVAHADEHRAISLMLQSSFYGNWPETISFSVITSHTSPV